LYNIFNNNVEMKSLKAIVMSALAGLMILTSACSSMTNLGKGALIGGTSGTALGAGIGALIGKGKGAAIGAAVGAAVGTSAGMLIGKKMDDKAKALEASLGSSATVDTCTVNDLAAVKVTFANGILFATGKSTISDSAKSALTEFASSINSDSYTNVHVYGFTDNTGTLAANTKVADARANAVYTYLVNSGVASSRLEYQGVPMDYYVASNETEVGRAQNRRVEVYITANQTMVDAANAGTLK
jgi:outer membrane protein OmpA-like peptidoglycan-associated protein